VSGVEGAGPKVVHRKRKYLEISGNNGDVLNRSEAQPDVKNISTISIEGGH